MNIKKLNLMKLLHIIIYVTSIVFCVYCTSPQAPYKKDTIFTNLEKSNAVTTLTPQKIEKIGNIPLPKGFFREDIGGEMGSFCRNLLLKPLDSPVRLFNGELKGNQKAHYAILDVDVGIRDLQQCADAVMRIRAEYLYEMERFDEIAFNFTSGDVCAWQKWKQGWRPVIKGSKVTWNKSQPQDNSYQNFRKYLNMVFTYAGSASLSKEMKSVNFKNMQIGDVFIQGGFPGHAVMVLDIAQNHKAEKVYILAQSYMPAQDIHILVNPLNDELSPWYALKDTNEITTPEWNFLSTDLMRF